MSCEEIKAGRGERIQKWKGGGGGGGGPGYGKEKKGTEERKGKIGDGMDWKKEEEEEERLGVTGWISTVKEGDGNENTLDSCPWGYS